MDKTFLDNTILQRPDFMALPAHAKGLWLHLQALCSSQENGGCLAGAGKWSNGAWQAAMGNGGGKPAFKKLLDLGLVKQAGDDVIVSGYHLGSEAKYRAARQNGAKGGKASAAGRAGAALPRERESGEPECADSLDDPGGDAQAALKRRSSAQGEEGEGPARNAKGSGDVGSGDVGSGDVGSGDVPRGSAAAGEALRRQDPTPLRPTSGSPGRIDPPPERDGEAQRAESARDPAEPDPGMEWVGSDVYRRQVPRRHR
jgi:hypothetical protein